MLTAAGARAGVLRGLPCLLGVTTGMALMMFLVPFGLASLVLAHPLALKMLRWGGAAFLLWLSWKMAMSAGHIDSTPGGDPIRYLVSAVFQSVNPKSCLGGGCAAATILN